MIIKVRIKTLEELINTKGVRVVDGDIEMFGAYSEFLEEMKFLCGKIIEIKEYRGFLFQTSDEKFAIEEWMCSEWNL